MNSNIGVMALTMLLVACAATAPTSSPIGVPDSGNPDMACPLPSNCVNSRGSGDLAPLRYAGTPVQAMAMLQATLLAFPEATVVRSEPLAMEVTFITPAGFRDHVNFHINPQAQRIDFRSRSSFGLFDFGKNRARMLEFATRFAQQSRR